ncbi:ATP-binding protein [Luteococcus sp. H138]|uniref:ATP-binding protein n=1 Tax=unclassified Luteococcus TaxID=2639923 RepID=UPI00313F1795
MVALAVVGVVCLVTIPSVVMTVNGSRLGVVGAVLAISHQVVTAVGIVRVASSRRLFWCAGAMLAASFALLMTHWNLNPGTAPWAPGFLAFGWVAWATWVLHLRSQIGLMLGFFAALALLDAALVGLARQPGHELLVSLWYLVPPLVMALFGLALRLVSHQVEQEMMRRRAILESTAWQRRELFARSEAARLLHDHILHALHAVARIGGEITPQMASDECASALRELEHPRSTDPTQSLRERLSADPLVDILDPIITGDTGQLPTDVTEAMAGAVHAALANVREHAQASRVSITLESQPRPRVEVSDDGLGFVPDRLPRQGLGLRHSIVARMEDVGGAAKVTSAPRRGTTVTLTWPREDGAPDPLWVGSTKRQVRRLLTLTALPGLAVTVVAAVLMAIAHGAWLVALCSLVPVAVGLVHCRTLFHRPGTCAEEVVLLVTGLASWWGLLALAPTTSPGKAVHGLWFLWACSALMHLAVLQQPVRRALLTVLGWVALAGLGLALSRSAWTLVQAWPVVLVPLGEGLATIAVQARVRLLERLQLDERRLTTESQQEVAARRRDLQLKDYWSQQVTGEAMPLIRTIADGLEITPERIRHAELLEATLRDELLLGPEQTTMLQVLNTLRRKGWHANTPSVTPDERVFLDAVAYWLTRIGEPVRHRQEVKVSISRGMATLVVLEPAAEQLALWGQTAGQLGAQLDSGPGFARLRAPLPDRPSGRY